MLFSALIRVESQSNLPSCGVSYANYDVPLTTVGIPPRTDATITRDNANRLFVIGGKNLTGSPLNDVWMSVNDGFSWTLQVPVNAPICMDDWNGCQIMLKAMQHRLGHTTTLDSDGTTLIITGGTDGIRNPGSGRLTVYTDAWKITDLGRNWTYILAYATNTPPQIDYIGTYGASALVYPTGNRDLYVFGGVTNDLSTGFPYACSRYVWVSSRSSGFHNWRYLTGGNYKTAGMVGCWQHSVFIEPVTGWLIQMGGQGDGPNFAYTNEIYDSRDGGTTWGINTVSAKWSPRGKMNVGIDSSNNIIMYGGCNAVTCFTDAWYSPAGSYAAIWYQLSPSLSTLAHPVSQMLLLNAFMNPLYPVLANMNGKRNVMLVTTNETDIFNLYGTKPGFRTISTRLNIMDYQSFVPCVIPNNKFTSAAATNMTVLEAATFRITSSGFTSPAYTLAGILPSGLTFNSISGLLSGTPTGPGGIFPVYLTASNGIGDSITQQLTITLNQAPMITASTVVLMVGSSSSSSFKINGTGYPRPTYGITTLLPNGLTLSSSTGMIDGTPARGTGGVYFIGVTASNGIGNISSQTLALTVNEAVVIDPAAPTSSTFIEGRFSSVSIQIDSRRFPLAVTFNIDGILPRGLLFTQINSTTCTINGTASAGSRGTYTMFISASNGVLPLSSQFHTITVSSVSGLSNGAQQQLNVKGVIETLALVALVLCLLFNI